ncbi:3,4-dioxygenase subunit beta [Ammonicoccus fulvus]|uniref:3,4-dioxygenase subunit beta n=1 Tax=Ammonicoccus fulvus TaxID=3138240 RepID=A0ABZ3FM78_9ACTN
MTHDLREETFPDNDAWVRAVHDRGLGFDLRMLSRRRALGLLGGLGLAGLTGCTGASPSASGTPGAATSGSAASSATAGGTASAAATGAACVPEVPDETAGPFPGDGSNGADALTTNGVVRTDIRSSFGGASGVAEGIPLTLRMTVLNLAEACAPMAGAAIYVWQCDRESNYSMYSSSVRNQNYLRGVAGTDAAGVVEFTTIFPGCYAGRWPHIHFQVFESVEAAISGRRQIVKTSQVAFPEDACRAVYAADGYATSGTNLSRVSLQTDSVFREDGGARQLATMAGSNAQGWTADLTIAVN